MQQITGASSNMQRRSGNMLPPPMDDYCSNNSSNGKPIDKSVSSVRHLKLITLMAKETVDVSFICEDIQQ